MYFPRPKAAEKAQVEKDDNAVMRIEKKKKEKEIVL